MTFASGAAMFNRSFKPAAIEIFTEHLQKYPDDYKALMWRSKAFQIVGKPDKAMQDLDKAITVSRGANRILALAERALLLKNIDDYANKVKHVTEEMPDVWEGWYLLGKYHSLCGDPEKTVECYRTALDVAKENGEINDPEICWINHSLGNIWLNRGEVEIAAEYFKAAIESSPTHTVSHIGLCQTHLIQGKFAEARSSFQTAKELNPDLVEVDTFDEYLVMLQQQNRKQQQQQRHGKVNKSKTQTKDNSYGGQKGNGSGSGSSSGSDSDENAGTKVNTKWKRLEKEAPCVKKFRGHKYVMSKCEKYWYSKDTAGHARAAFKRYQNTKNALRFMDSLDENMQPMVNKHESREGTVIYKNEMTGVRGK